MKTLTHHEIQQFDRFSSLIIQVLELPRDELLLCYLDRQASIPRFFLWSQEKPQWTIENQQNESNFTTILPSHARIEATFFGFDNKGDLLLFFNQCNKEKNWDLFLLESSNYAKSWSTLRQISPEFQSWRVISPPFILQYGTLLGHLLLPVEDEMTQRKLLLISENNGSTWAPSFYLDIEDEQGEKEEQYDTLSQPSLNTVQNPIEILRIIDLPSGEIVLYHTRRNMGGLWQQISRDGGYTWQSPEQLKISPPILSNLMDVITDSTEPNQPKAYLMGTFQNKMIRQLGVWSREYQEEEFRLIWNSSELGVSLVDWCQLLMDYQGNFHIFYQTGSTLHHFWDSLQKM